MDEREDWAEMKVKKRKGRDNGPRHRTWMDLRT